MFFFHKTINNLFIIFFYQNIICLIGQKLQVSIQQTSLCFFISRLFSVQPNTKVCQQLAVIVAAHVFENSALNYDFYLYENKYTKGKYYFVVVIPCCSEQVSLCSLVWNIQKTFLVTFSFFEWRHKEPWSWQYRLCHF